MYFDEIYHARTAYEFPTDCPLMKIRIRPRQNSDFCGYRYFRDESLRLADHGYFIWHRHAALPHLLWKKMTGNTPQRLSPASCLPLILCILHQTRIATIDVYITFFRDCHVLFYVQLLLHEFFK